MKKLVLLFVLAVMVFAPAMALADDPQFKIEITGSDHAGFSVLYSWPGEGKPPIECTVIVRVKYSQLGKKGGGSEEFTFKNKLHNTGSGWAYFDGKAGLDTSAPLDMKIDSSSCK